MGEDFNIGVSQAFDGAARRAVLGAESCVICRT